MDGFVDEFKMYNRALTSDEIQADAAFALGGVEPSFVELGCMGTGCDLQAHIATVTPYALLAAAVALFAGSIPVAAGLYGPLTAPAVGTAVARRQQRLRGIACVGGRRRRRPLCQRRRVRGNNFVVLAFWAR